MADPLKLLAAWDYLSFPDFPAAAEPRPKLLLLDPPAFVEQVLLLPDPYQPDPHLLDPHQRSSPHLMNFQLHHPSYELDLLAPLLLDKSLKELFLTTCGRAEGAEP
ncbi:hypothetical protein PCANC_28607 [Puccinia coronata f. sp. avenae]|uniref:Uncharacterized protein n=1 Tax=Puccinia coronata f. sp. avenae TaxID=200324 RepID=A0A2N5TMW8_9BASI|nr:hypothetical protein PCANC_28607 [Puccinia coronata f. sp. avenae]